MSEKSDPESTLVWSTSSRMMQCINPIPTRTASDGHRSALQWFFHPDPERFYHDAYIYGLRIVYEHEHVWLPKNWIVA